MRAIGWLISVFIALLAICCPAWSQSSCGHPHGDYVVVNVKFNDPIHGLAVRDQPSGAGAMRGVIPANGTGIGVDECQSSGWCRVRYACLNGWSLLAKYLAPSGRQNYKVIDVSPSDPQGLNLRSRPDGSSDILGAAAYNATNVLVHACEPNGPTNWCLVTSGKVSGYAARRFLAPSPIEVRITPPVMTPPAPSAQPIEVAAPQPQISPAQSPSARPPSSPSSETPLACIRFPNLC